MRNLKNLENKRLALLGLGVENLALLKYLLAKKVQAEYSICDFRSWQTLGSRYEEINRLATRAKISLKWQLEDEYNQHLDRYDILFRSPGWTIRCPGIKAALKKNKEIVLTSPIELFLRLCPSKNVIGVTGSKGKGTTASLIFAILKHAKKKVYLGGNIGIAPFEFINKIKTGDWVVLELSSFQLQGLTISPRIGVITNFTREHMAPADPNNPNYHLSMNEYWQAKMNIARWQPSNGKLVANKKLAAKIKKEKSHSGAKNGVRSKVIYFEHSSLPSRLIGEHNQENVAAAVEAAKLASVKQEQIKAAVAKFGGLEHRIEFVRETNGVRFYNDSFATTPEATITALKSFSTPIVLLAGGAEKKSDFKSLAKEIKRRVKFLVLLEGAATMRLGDELLKIGFSEERMKLVYNIKEAVDLAAAKANQGEVVLLSTACASFGMFNNYKERGLLYKEEVSRL